MQDVCMWILENVKKVCHFSNRVPRFGPQIKYVPNCYFKSRICAPLLAWIWGLEKSSTSSLGKDSSGKVGLFGGRYKKVLKLVIDKNGNINTYEIPESTILRYLLNEATSETIQRLEVNIALSDDETVKRQEMIDKLKILSSNINKEEKITDVEFYKNKMGWIPDLMGLIHHKFLVFKTVRTKMEFWWSLEKNTEYFVMQGCSDKGAKDAVKRNLEGNPRKSVKRMEEKFEGKGTMYDLLQYILIHGIIGEKYHLINSNCQQLVEFLSKKITAEEYESRGAIRYSDPPLANGITRNIFDLTKVIKFSDWDPIHALIYMDKPELLATAVQNEDYDINGIYNEVTPLNLAILFSRTEMVDCILNEMDADPTKSDARGRSPIQMAAMFSTKGPEIIELLLQTNQVDVNDHDEKWGNTALHMAALAPNVENARYLLERGANPNAINNTDTTPLHAAALSGDNTDIIDLILNAEPKVNINQRDKNEMTPLHYAVCESNVQVVRHLLDKGADPNARDNEGKSPLDMAAMFGKDVELIDVLLENGKVQVNDCDKETGNTALHHAAMNSNALTADHLLKKGANPKLKNKNDDIALHKAAMLAENTDIIDVLLDSTDKKDIEARGSLGMTPLYCAMRNSNSITTRHLLDKGADPTAQTNEGKPLLVWALLYGNNQLLDIIFNAKPPVNINQRDQNGMTPLHYAISNSKVETVRYLLEKGADPTLADNSGTTPFAMAVIYGDDEKVIDLLLKTGKVHVDDYDEATGNTALHRVTMTSNARQHPTAKVPESIRQLKDTKQLQNNDQDKKLGNVTLPNVVSNFKKARYLLESGANPNPVNKDGATPLHLAALYRQNVDLIDLLLNAESKVDIDQRDQNGMTPLHYAIHESNVKYVRHFLNKGADPKTRDNYGRSPLDVAAMFGQDVELIDSLLETGQVHVEDQDRDTGDTALHRAAMKSNNLTARYLLEKGADLNALTKEDATPLHFAAALGKNTDIINMFLTTKNMNIEVPDKYGRTPIHYAIYGSNYLTLSHLLSLGADPNKSDIFGTTPLQLAAISAKDINIFQLLLDQQVNLKVCDRNGTDIYAYAMANTNKLLAESIVNLLSKSLGTKS